MNQMELKKWIQEVTKRTWDFEDGWVISMSLDSYRELLTRLNTELEA